MHMFVLFINIFSLSVLFIGGYAINGSSFGSGDVPTVVGSINCSGTEQMLTDCQITSTAISSCNESTVAGILCYGTLYFVINLNIGSLSTYNKYFHFNLVSCSLSGRSEHYLQ